MLIDLGKASTKPLKRFGFLAYRSAKKIIKLFFLTIILNGYFLLLKLRKKIKFLALSGTHRLLEWLNIYIYRLTVLLIIIFTIGYSLFGKPSSAEELKSHIMLNQITADPNDETIVTLIEEGPLTKSSMQRTVSYLDAETTLLEDYVEAHLSPDTDSDNFYTTIEDDSAIIAPVITEPGALHPLQRDSTETYLVKAGDTIGTISQKFGINIYTILWANKLQWNSTIQPGQSLAILPTDGVVHTVKSGDSLSQIAKKYQADLAAIIEQNKLADASDIRAGEQLMIPDGIQPTTVASRPRQNVSLPAAIKDIFIPPAANTDTGSKFLWPLLSHRITQYFHLRHTGVDVGDKRGGPIYAAESGRVERAGWTSGYGYNVVINHGNGLKTLYGHSSNLLVKVGDLVIRGQVIALIGSTGRSTGPHLHFEVRVNNIVTNPLNYIR